MTEFATPFQMHYAKHASRLSGGGGLKFDTRYRVAQLPLIDPSHPLSLNDDPDGRYCQGKRAASYSLVIKVDGHALSNSKLLCDLLNEVKASPLGAKIVWPMEKRRRDVLHATICGSLPHIPPQPFPALEREKLACIERFCFRIQGFFVGSFNTGRIYLCLYPEMRGAGSATDLITQAMGGEPNRLLLCGYLNLRDELNAEEAILLEHYCRKSGKIVFDTQTCIALSVLESFDDLVLASRGIDSIRLSMP